MNSIAIFCGSKAGNESIFIEQAQKVGAYLADQGKRVVYGGGRTGLMGVIADSALQAGGKVIGVIPTNLVDRELAHPQLTELHIVDNMHERKAKMAELADGFIALPGGAGTLEEIFEQWTWAQLGIHLKPCAFLNIHDFYTPLFDMIHRTVETGFTQARFAEQLFQSESIEEILEKFKNYQAPEPKWGVQ
ncbi:TIGR00730 family Rossman fold protein [Acinetobacter nectaris]|uniref:LOG family protein n=1 Tax=Acinetobacter nectaris TaxID=1219382 RepID=UPI001F3D502D|nr:TIGR00730 family Rossman fold protein [Acinetobacter nectaris]MCF9027763.1 TIGR00730 family Rossman fold protein [Acinetobacter nectaris]